MFLYFPTKGWFASYGAYCLLATCCVSTSCHRLPGIRQFALEKEKRITAETEEAIKNSPIYQELDRVCLDIPKPEAFQLISKSKSFNERIYLTYAYYSPDAFEKMKPFYIDYFEKNGWEDWGDTVGLTTNGIKFRKGDFEVSVYYSTRDEGVNYLFGCEKLR